MNSSEARLFPWTQSLIKQAASPRGFVVTRIPDKDIDCLLRAWTVNFHDLFQVSSAGSVPHGTSS
jgi:hypothetical protein